MYAQLIERPSSIMARKSNVDLALLLPFAAWLVKNIERRGCSMQCVADAADMHVSHLHKIVKSYLPGYSQYQRPGYEKTVLIGQLFGDVKGALESAGYEVQPQYAGLASSGEPAPRPMMTFIEQQLRLLPHGTVNSLTPDQADQLVSELEELAALRIAQVQRQGKS